MHACTYTCNIHVVVVARMTKTLPIRVSGQRFIMFEYRYFWRWNYHLLFPCKNGGSLNLIHCYYYNYEMVFKMSMAIGYANIVYMGLNMCERKCQ
jgi:hypothetical protein